MKTLAAVGAVALLMTGCDAGRRMLVHYFGNTYAPPDVAANGPVNVKLKEVASGFDQITDVQFVPGQPRRMVVVEKSGAARILDLDDGGGRKVGTLFKVDVLAESELGLLGLAFHPRFAENGRFYVNFNPKDGKMRTRISEWTIAPADLGKTEAKETRVVLEVEQPYQNHNAGQLAFGPDGMLYFGLGDGGWMGDPQGNGQNPGVLLGKMLRVDINNTDGKPYAVPTDNPFVGKEGWRPEIWALGLRNPWRFSFAPDGRLLLADVGQDLFEEVDIVERGANLGWSVREATHCFEPKQDCRTEGLVDPIFEYGRTDGTSITGGYVYDGSAVPSLRGSYVFADFTSGKMWALQVPAGITLVKEARLIGTFRMLTSSFGRDAAGEIYAADFAQGTVSMLVPAP